MPSAIARTRQPDIANLLDSVGWTAERTGDRLTLRPGRVDPNMQANARRLAAAGYRRGTNWIAGRGNPVPRRGDVPLDVIVAAAEG